MARPRPDVTLQVGASIYHDVNVTAGCAGRVNWIFADGEIGIDVAPSPFGTASSYDYPRVVLISDTLEFDPLDRS